MTRAAAVVVLTVGLLFVPTAPPLPQCDQINFRRANPGLCEPELPFPTFPPGAGGGGPDGGLLERIFRGLGGLL